MASPRRRAHVRRVHGAAHGINAAGAVQSTTVGNDELVDGVLGVEHWPAEADPKIGRMEGWRFMVE